MFNKLLICKILGTLLWIEAAFMSLGLILAICHMESDIMAFAVTVGVTLLVGTALRLLGRHATNTLGRRDAYLLVTIVWIAFAAFGMLPFLIGGYIDHVTDAFFETMSGLTTTGATVIDKVEGLPHGILFWRSLTQWIGGLGIVFFTIAVIPSFVGGSIKVFAAEATGPIKSKMHPRLTTTAKALWGVYILLTAVCAFCFFIFGMSPFDAVNYAMTVTATGGFATHDASTGYFNNAAIDYTAIVFMFLSGVSFALLYASLLQGKIKQLFKNAEFRFYTALTLAATAVIVYFLLRYNHYTLSDAIRYALFQVVSFVTTTGMFNEDAAQWHHITWVVLSLCMFFGGCAGSTASGFKCARGVIALKILRNEVRRMVHPKALLPVKVNNTSVHSPSQITLLAFFIAYITLCFTAYFIMILAGVDSTNSITIALSCGSNVGPTLGLEIGPTMSWSILPPLVKWILSGLMLMGRLEIFTVLVIFSPSFWKNH
ncbi:MAG: TrkH family potassium uptake protein [Muribaculaceae bacterium]|jgi:trk system potassium uptake protein TrkH|nr:TrkH family potassium uptake protein [Muribaculaceae bacterium]